MLAIRRELRTASSSLSSPILLLTWRSLSLSKILLLDISGSLEFRESLISYLSLIKELYSSFAFRDTCIAVIEPSLLIIRSLYIGLLIISSLARARLMPSDVKSFKLSATSVRPTRGWKNIGASMSDKTESTPSIRVKSFSILRIVSSESLVKSSPFGSYVTYKKFESPNSSSASL